MWPSEFAFRIISREIHLRCANVGHGSPSRNWHICKKLPLLSTTCRSLEGAEHLTGKPNVILNRLWIEESIWSTQHLVQIFTWVNLLTPLFSLFPTVSLLVILNDTKSERKGSCDGWRAERQDYKFYSSLPCYATRTVTVNGGALASEPPTPLVYLKLSEIIKRRR